MTTASTQSSFSPRARWKIALHVVLSVLAFSAIVVMVNFIAARHSKRFHWTADARFELSPQTADVLRSLTNRVKVIVYFDRAKPLYGMAVDLLNQYQQASSRLDVEYVDYQRSPGRARLVEAEYGLAAAEEGDRILFDYGGRRKVVYAKELSEYDYNALLKGKEVKLIGFKGEQLFTSALYSLIEAKPAKVYFLSGHGEHDPTQTDEQFGYLKFAQVLQENQIPFSVLEPTALVSYDVPQDCQLLIVPNPQTRLEQRELDHIERYLGQGGRMFVLFSSASLNTQTGLEKLLENWGVEVGYNFVFDQGGAKAGDMRAVYVTHFANHPIVSPLARSRLFLIVPRSVSARAKGPQGADAPKVVELATTGPDGAASKGKGRFEKLGTTIPLMVAVEKGAIQGVATDRGATRVVVVGESYFLANRAIDEGENREFARNAVNWLLNREILVQGIGSHPIKEYQFNMTAAELNRLRWLFLGAFPGSVLFVGCLVWLRRRA